MNARPRPTRVKKIHIAVDVPYQIVLSIPYRAGTFLKINAMMAAMG
jgi:hypothetical protein